MSAIRLLMRQYRALSLLLIGAALLARALVPAGYMPSGQSRSFTVLLCSDASAAAMRIVIPGAPSSPSPHDQRDHPCAFGSLAGAALSGADAVLLTVAFGHIIATGYAPVAPPILQGFFRLRPPLRGPPILS